MNLKELIDLSATTWKFDKGAKYPSEEIEAIFLALALGSEVGEFQRLLTRMFRQKYHTKGHPLEGAEAELPSELADVLYFTLRLADALKIDLEAAFKEKMEINIKRYNEQK